MLSVLRGTGEGDIPGDELERARNYAAGTMQLRLQSSQATAAEILEAWIHSELHVLPSVADELRAVAGDDVRRVSRRRQGGIRGAGKREDVGT